MKEIDTWDLMQLAFEDLKKNSITTLEFHEWCDEYEKDHPEFYTYISRNDIHHEHDCQRIWWEIIDQGSDIIHKQETITCPCCDHEIYKHPNTGRFYRVKKMQQLMKI